jgi:hypothetical protein
MRDRPLLTLASLVMIASGMILVGANSARLEHTHDPKAPIIAVIGAGAAMIMLGALVLAIIYRPRR